ncbi:MAG: peptidoglycan DD-metalloendopeptidase family protein [Candidatus Micropelagos thuwalensis]|nr:peptidoglycan DD-metalloendopeptidase family protein [Candidatus Micropelagos thuwalensis]
MKSRVIVAFLLFGSCIAFSMPDMAMHPAYAQTKEKRQLKSLEKEIRERDEKRVQLEKQAEQIATQRRKLQLNMIFIAEQIRANEQRQININKKLDALLMTQDNLIAALNKDRVNLSQSLAALQRFEKSTPPALAVRPDDALEGIRGALAMASIVPSLKQKVDEIHARLDELSAIRRQILKRQKELDDALIKAENDRAKLDVLVTEKQQAEASRRQEAASEQAAIKELAAKARNLKDLVTKLEKRRARQHNQIEGFSRTRGKLPLPVSGKLLSRPETIRKNTETGREGAYMTTRVQSLVTAPYDAQVLYAGPFRDYGNMLILGVGKNYHLLFAGLSEISVDVGQVILAGEPVGQIIPEPLTNAPKTLYMEIRYKGQPQDPLSWYK